MQSLPACTPCSYALSMAMGKQFLILVLVLLIPRSAGIPENESFSCSGNGPCRAALASDNPVTLKCSSNASVHWQHINAANPYRHPLTFIQSSGLLTPPEDLDSEMQLLITSLASRSELIAGDLRVVSPSVHDTGVYICKDGQKTHAYYEIDFQDARRIHISHVGLRQNVQLNTIAELGDEGTILMMTVWSYWQPCNRCGTLGERKRIGFCYAVISKDAVPVGGPLPCGLLKSALKGVQFNHSMELQIELCQEECMKSLSVDEEDTQTEIQSNYRAFPYADIILKCPMTSIYRPIYWEHSGKPITWLQQLNGKSFYLLDSVTGGGTLSIPLLDNEDNGSYTCYVDRKLAETFQVIFQEEDDDEEPLGVHEYALMGLGAFVFLCLIMAHVQVFREAFDRDRR